MTSTARTVTLTILALLMLAAVPLAVRWQETAPTPGVVDTRGWQSWWPAGPQTPLD